MEAYKTMPYKSDKQKGRENKRHLKNMEEVMKELVLFNIPTRDKNGTIMTKIGFGSKGIQNEKFRFFPHFSY